SSFRERNNVRRSRARSVADSVAGPNTAEDDFTSGEPHRFRTDAARFSRGIKSAAVRRQKSVAVDQRRDRLAKQCLSRVGSEPDKSEKGQQARSAAHDQARGRRIYSDNCYSRRLETLPAR